MKRLSSKTKLDVNCCFCVMIIVVENETSEFKDKVRRELFLCDEDLSSTA